MKVIMLKDVKGVGQRGQVPEVADGFAQNFLIPRGAAEQATKEKLLAYEARQKVDAANTAEREQEWEAAAKKIDGATIVVTARSNAAVHLYNQLPLDQIARAVQETLGIEVPQGAIALNTPIKSV